MHGLGVHLLPARPSEPGFPVRRNLGWHIGLELLSQSCVALRCLFGTSNPGNARQPCTDVVVILSRLGAGDKAALRKDGDELVLDEGDNVSPVGNGSGEEVCVGHFALVDLQNTTIGFEFLGVEVLERRAFGRLRVLLQGVLACVCSQVPVVSSAGVTLTVRDKLEREAVRAVRLCQLLFVTL